MTDYAELAGEMEAAATRGNGRDPLEVAGLSTLAASADLGDVAVCLRRLAPLLPADALGRRVIRNRAIAALRQIDVLDAAGLVDAALSSGAAQDADSQQGAAVSLEDVEPWPDPVDGAELLAELARTLTRFATLPEGAPTTLSLWIVHAHALEAAQVSPVLAITSPEKECGKTTVLTLLLGLTPRAVPASNITSAGVFRVVERFRPTLLVDEADTFLRDNEELRGILNSGHFRAGAHVVRTVGDDFEPRFFSTWCPKAIALIGELPDTLTSRSVPVRMRRATAAEAAELEVFRLDRLHELEPLRRQACRWVQDHLAELKAADPAVPPGLRGRAADNWRPLLAIADVVGGMWPDRARRAAALFGGGAGGEDQAPGAQLLADIRDLFAERGRPARLSSADVVDALVKLEDRPWPEWRKGKPLTTTQLARLLRRFGIRPKHLRDGGIDFRGYLWADFGDAFARYLPCDTSDPSRDSSADLQVSPEKPHGSSIVTPVTLPGGGLEPPPEEEQGDAFESEDLFP